MNENQKDERNQLVGSKSNQALTGEKEDNPSKRPRIPVPDKPIRPIKSEKAPEPIPHEPGVNEPEKSDPTRIDEPPTIIS